MGWEELWVGWVELWVEASRGWKSWKEVDKGKWNGEMEAIGKKKVCVERLLVEGRFEKKI